MQQEKKDVFGLDSKDQRSMPERRGLRSKCQRQLEFFCSCRGMHFPATGENDEGSWRA